MASSKRRRISITEPPDLSDSDPLNTQTPDPTSQPHCVETSRPDVTMATVNTSSKFTDIISKSILIQSGSPDVYQLKPKKENVGTLRRMTLGEKDPNKTNRTILLVGETGTGKSTLVNALVNYTLGVKWEDDVWFQIVEEEKRSQSESQTSEEDGQTESQTSDVIVYQIFGFEDQTLPYSLTIIDTPGYGDTRGIEQDDIISQRLLDLFTSYQGLREINAVGLVMKASDTRLSDRLMYIFDSVVSLFGRNMEKNIVALITHSDGLPPENVLKALKAANIKCAKDEKNEPVYFLFNNCQSEERTEDTESLKRSYKKTSRGLSQFRVFLEKTEPQMLETTLDILNGRNRLRAAIRNLKERIKLTELQQRDFHRLQEALKKHEQEKKNNENFTVEVDEVYKVKETISGGWWGSRLYKAATCCTVCEENCHYPGCTVAGSPSLCEVMEKGHCTSCTRKCPVSDHVKEKWIYVSKTRKVKKTLKEIEKYYVSESKKKEVQELKEKFEKSKSDCEETTSLLENLKKKMEKLQREKDQMLDESFDLVVKLEQIALNVDSVSTLVHLDFLIEKMDEEGDTEKVQKLEEIKRRVEKNKGVRAGLRYRQTAAVEMMKC